MVAANRPVFFPEQDPGWEPFWGGEDNELASSPFLLAWTVGRRTCMCHKENSYAGTKGPTGDHLGRLPNADCDSRHLGAST